MIRVEGHKNLYRDEKSGAIINNDSMKIQLSITDSDTQSIAFVVIES